MKDSHHRNLWNEYMVKLDCRDSMVVEESREMANSSNESLFDSLVEGTGRCCSTMGLYPP